MVGAGGSGGHRSLANADDSKDVSSTMERPAVRILAVAGRRLALMGGMAIRATHALTARQDQNIGNQRFRFAIAENPMKFGNSAGKRSCAGSGWGSGRLVFGLAADEVGRCAGGWGSWRRGCMRTRS